MSAITYYVALPFKRGEDGELVADIPRECPSPLNAIQTARRLASDSIGAIAFARSGDPETGEFTDAVVLQAFGETLSLDELVDAHG
jgi:hypothetical protein